MRITALELNGFRGFAKTQHFELDADAVIIIGANGQGKTSFFDGVLWAITGSVPRLGGNDRHVMSMYSESGECRVSVEFRTAAGEPCRVVRSFDGQQQHLLININGDGLRGTAAKARLLELLWPEAKFTPDGDTALTAAITRSVYLQQDLIRQFIEVDSEQDRFRVVSELVGAGRVTELQLQLDRTKVAWTRATNTRVQEWEAARQRLASLQEHMAHLGQTPVGSREEIESVWAAWWSRAQQLGVEIQQGLPADSLESSSALDIAIRQLQALRRSNDRRYSIANMLFHDIQTRSGMTHPDIAILRAAFEEAEQNVRLAQEALTQAEIRAAQERRAQVERRQSREELRALAQLALRHLGERCPVCDQGYAEARTRQRLEMMAAISDDEDRTPQSADEVTSLASILESRERDRSITETRLRQGEQAAKDYQHWLLERDQRLSELQLDPELESDLAGALETLMQRISETTAFLVTLQEEGERIALKLAQAGEHARRLELEQELAVAQRDVDELTSTIQTREQAGALAGQILDGLREAAADVVKVQLERIEPLLQRVYARIDPHPAFRNVRFQMRLSRGRGRLTTAIDDLLTALSTDAPSAVLSSSQMNALAVSVFLAFNLGVPSPPLSVAMLDDPLQSLDDVNLLGLIDLLRRVKDCRQLIVSTHDSRFGQLLARKLRPSNEHQRTHLIELEGWGRDGSVVVQRDVQANPRPLRIAG